MNELLRFEHVSKTIYNKKVLENLSFSLFNNESLEIVCSNHLEKETLLHLLLLRDQPDNGDIYLNNKALLKMKARERRLAQQQILLIDDHTINSLYNDFLVAPASLKSLLLIYDVSFKIEMEKTAHMMFIKKLKERFQISLLYLSYDQKSHLDSTRTLILKEGRVVKRNSFVNKKYLTNDKKVYKN
ncbi:hypothetical protein [Metabacillus iocasae]|uniref:ABC-type transporter Mla maintaining outer membrane lipid asymmetry ATPase subunit MlaF n=1 Tax=Priestia iocasae TaxID=2291674 RepID=A0ABS2QXD2_9BACI|nr:hypothetical protein [Metabacillus iocasae]MBM7703833.1 ABC-type transporter Mla maintaining outer membrane lipid asymmetry ATPase subunit MlaF [Metabacillus iocasae]